MQICKEIHALSSCIKAAHIGEEREKLDAHQPRLYIDLRKVQNEEPEKYKRSQKTVYNMESVMHDGDD